MASLDLPNVVANQGETLLQSRCKDATEPWENSGKLWMSTSDGCGMRSAVWCPGGLLSYWYNFERRVVRKCSAVSIWKVPNYKTAFSRFAPPATLLTQAQHEQR